MDGQLAMAYTFYIHRYIVLLAEYIKWIFYKVCCKQDALEDNKADKFMCFTFSRLIDLYISGLG